MRIDELSLEQIEIINSYRKIGYGAKKIANITGIPEWEVRNAPIGKNINVRKLPSKDEIKSRNLKILKYYSWEFSPEEISNLVNCTSGYVLDFLDKNNLPHDFWKTERANKIVKLRSMGYSMKDIAFDFGLTPSAISRICNEYNVGGNLAQLEFEVKKCKFCGKEFKAYKNQNKLFCCVDHQKKYARSINDPIRRARKKSKIVDKDISISKLIKRDNSICALCGKPIDENDFYFNNGKKTAGRMYPTIDHIVPLSKGGNHSWSNVQLAHFCCNSSKGARI